MSRLNNIGNIPDVNLPLLGGRADSRDSSSNKHRRNITTIDQDSNPYNVTIPKITGTLPISSPSPLKFRTLSTSKISTS
jgi:hypothetical protein